MENLIGIKPDEVMLHGPSKQLIDNVHWHHPHVGIVVSYTPKPRDVVDHFGVFRGVDQIESFAQASIVACTAFLETKKLNCTFDDLKANFIPLFLGIGKVDFRNYVLEGELIINIGHIKFYKWRQMVCDGRIYKVRKGLNLDEYFKDYTEEQLLNYELSDDFTLVAELFDVTGRGLKKDKYVI